MKYFKEVNNLPVYEDLHNHLNFLMNYHKLRFESNQICLNDIEENSSNVYRGCGSLFFDWIDGKKIRKSERLDESEFKFLCNQFKETPFEEIYNCLKHSFKIGRIRIMQSKPSTCLSWHIDDTDRIHFPIKTQEGCFMVIEDEIKHLSQNQWWYTHTKHKHTAFNGSLDNRYHFVASVINY